MREQFLRDMGQGKEADLLQSLLILLVTALVLSLKVPGTKKPTSLLSPKVLPAGHIAARSTAQPGGCV